jgi:hypothetical protein
MGEALLADPAALFNQLSLHDRDLPSRAAETDKPQPQPKREGLPPGHRTHR